MGILDSTITVAQDPGPWSILIYGDWGSGKTVLACQANKPLLLDCEKGRKSLLNHPELVGIPIKPIRSLNEAKQMALNIKNDKDENIKTVIVDTVTTLQFKDLSAIMNKLPDGRDPDLPSMAEFNRDNRRVARFIQELLDACESTGRNVVILAHIKEEKDDEGNITLIRPGTSPALTQALAPMVDCVFYLSHVADSKGEIKRELHTVATRKIKGKNRFGSLPTKIENPHFSVIEKAAETQKQYALQLLEKGK